ncbi:MAG: hypothetical protein ACHP65_05350, partial [Legionellales bacterium]
MQEKSLIKFERASKEEQWAAEAHQVLEPLIALLQKKHAEKHHPGTRLLMQLGMPEKWVSPSRREDVQQQAAREQQIERLQELLSGFDAMPMVQSAYTGQYHHDFLELMQSTLPQFHNKSHPFKPQPPYSTHFYSYQGLTRSLELAISYLSTDSGCAFFIDRAKKFSLRVWTPLDRLFRPFEWFSSRSEDGVETALKKYSVEQIAEALTRLDGSISLPRELHWIVIYMPDNDVWLEQIKRSLLKMPSDKALVVLKNLFALPQWDVTTCASRFLVRDYCYPLKPFIKLAPMEVSLFLYQQKDILLQTVQEMVPIIAPQQSFFFEDEPVQATKNITVLNEYIQSLEKNPVIFLAKKNGPVDRHHQQMQLALFEAISSELFSKMTTSKNPDVQNELRVQLMT